jgi:hypothetical protein
MAVLPLILTTLALATQIGANVLTVGPHAGNDISTAHQKIDKRDEASACAESVLSQLKPPKPSNTEFLEWYNSATTPYACTVTAPASLSSEYSSYAGVVSEWLDTVESKAAQQTDCGMKSFVLIVPSVTCDGPRTVLFTDSAKRTTTATQEPFNYPTSPIQIGAATHHPRALGSVVALSVILGVVAVL